MSISIVAGCAKSRAETTSPGVMMDAGDELGALEQQLARREAQLQAVGSAAKATSATSGPGEVETKPEAQTPSTAPPRPVQTAPQPDMAGARIERSDAEDMPTGGRCEQVCEIAAAICTLEGQICGLVPRHPDDPRYQAACERAAGDCRFATEACDACR